MEDLKLLEKEKVELEKEIKSFMLPLYYTQVLKRDELIKKLKQVKYKIFILKNTK